MTARVFGIGALLVASGAAALTFQTVWFRLFRLVFGASTPSFGAVLAIFMGGLGIGSLFWGRRADRHPSPLRLYALLEAGVAVTAAATPFLLDFVFPLYASLGGEAGLGAFRAQCLRLALSALVLAVPTFLMGGTLPAAAKAVASGDDRARRNVAFLYGANTAGAVLGVFLSTFWLLERFGCRQLLWLACLVLSAAAAAAWAIAPRFAGPAAESSSPDKEPAAPARLVLPASAATGFAFFFLELVWYRMLSPLLGGSVFTFGLILSLALAGIGAGGFAYAALRERFRPSLRAFSITCALEALFVALPFALGDRIARLAWLLRPGADGGFPELVAGAVVFAPALVAGFQYPLLIALLGEGRKRVGSHVGDTAAWNTAGAIAGSLAGGFGLLSLLTAPGSWRLVVVLLVALQLAAAAFAATRSRRRTTDISSLGLAAATLCLLFATGPTAAWRHGGIGMGRAKLPDRDPATFEGWARSVRGGIASEREGRESSVAVSSAGALLINGKSDGSAVDDAGTQILSPLIGAALHPDARRALVIGLGTGSSAGWLGRVPSIERVDVIELEPAVVRAAGLYAQVNADPFSNPNVPIRIGDGREFLMTTAGRYDLVLSEPSNPFRAGISSLFTAEFYRAASARLNRGGVFLQWLQAYEIDRAAVATVFATIGSVFPHVHVWRLMSADLLLFASSEPIRFDADRLATKLRSEPFRTALDAAWSAEGPEGFLSHYLGGERLARAIGGEAGGALNTDDGMALEFAFARRVGRTSPFAVDELRALAVRLGDDRPAVRNGSVDWERAEDSWASFLTTERIAPAGRGPKASAKRLFLDGSAAALDVWRKQADPPRDPVERALVAEGLAMRRDPSVTPLLRELAASHPAEAAAIGALLAWRRGNLAGSARSLGEAVRAYREHPWALRFVMARALGLAPGIGRMDREAGKRLFGALEKPFPFHLANEARLNALVALADTLGFGEFCRRVVRPIEPFPPWQEQALRWRLRCYEETGNPLRATAALELDQFLRMKPPSPPRR